MSSRRGHISKGTFLTSSSYDAVAKDRVTLERECRCHVRFRPEGRVGR